MNRGKVFFLKMQICVLDIDVQGGEKIYNNDIECNFIFIDAPSIEALEQRLKHRGTESPEVI